MFDLFSGEQFDRPDIEDLAAKWRDHGIHLVERGVAAADPGVRPLTYTDGELANDPDAPFFELLRLASLGRLMLTEIAKPAGEGGLPALERRWLRERAMVADLKLVELMKGRG